jgi:hypothetical protein
MSSQPLTVCRLKFTSNRQRTIFAAFTVNVTFATRLIWHVIQWNTYRNQDDGNRQAMIWITAHIRTICVALGLVLSISAGVPATLSMHQHDATESSLDLVLAIVPTISGAHCAGEISATHSDSHCQNPASLEFGASVGLHEQDGSRIKGLVIHAGLAREILPDLPPPRT